MHVFLAIGLATIALAGCAAPQQQASAPAAPPPCMQTGLASWYRATTRASRQGPDALTAAHESLPFGTQLLVTEITSGRSVIVRVTDRGPFKPGRIIDLSAPAASSLGMKQDGVTQVRLEIYQPPGSAASPGSCLFPHTTES